MTIIVAPCSTVRGAAEVPISVLTQPGQIELTVILSSAKSFAKDTVKAFNAVGSSVVVMLNC
ncbi:hypothetical protein CAL7716_090540 [Calothrix sp. PCC 7716]|nr:hypothetical protein CAL7716_090540 [Calothrix sp. PCC 7716]